jgi:hypothetical protein
LGVVVDGGTDIVTGKVTSLPLGLEGSLALGCILVTLVGCVSPGDTSGRWLPVLMPVSCVTILFLPGHLILSACPGLVGVLRSGVEIGAISALLSIILDTAFCVFTLESGLQVRHGLGCALGIMAIACGYMLYRGLPLAFTRRCGVSELDGTSLSTIVAFVVLFAVAAMAFAAGGYIDREQTILARKIAESVRPHKFSIMYLPGAAHTYLYEPLGFLVGLVANATGGDVIVITDRFWAVLVFLTGLFGAAFVVTATRWRAGASLFIGLYVVILFGHPLEEFGRTALFAPYPNRYGFGPGVLTVAGFWLILLYEQTDRARRWIAAWIPVFILTMVLFHAREGLLTLLIYAMFAGTLLLVERDRRHVASRYGPALVIATMLLGAFSIYHKSNVGHVGSVTGELRAGLGKELTRMLANPALAVAGEYRKTFPIFVGKYELGGFYEGLIRSAPTAIAFMLMFVLVVLPMMAVARPAKWVWLGVAGVTGLLTICRFPLLFTGMSWAVGTTDLFHCQSTFYSLVAVIGVSGFIELARLTPAAGQWAGRGASRLFAGVGERPMSRVRAGMSVVAAISPGAAVVIFFLTAYPWLGWAQARPYSVYWIHAGLVITAVGIVVFRRGQQESRVTEPGGAVERSVEPSRREVVACAALILACAACHGTVRGAGESFGRVLTRRIIEEGGAVSDIYREYDRLIRKPNMASPFPVGLCRFLRERVAPLRKFITDATVATTVPLYANLYVAHAGIKLSTDRPYYERWFDRRGAHPLFNDRPLAEFWRINLEFLQAFDIDYILVDPVHRGKVVAFTERVNAVRRVFETAYQERGFSVVQVNRADIPMALKQLDSALIVWDSPLPAVEGSPK